MKVEKKKVKRGYMKGTEIRISSIITLKFKLRKNVSIFRTIFIKTSEQYKNEKKFLFFLFFFFKFIILDESSYYTWKLDSTFGSQFIIEGSTLAVRQTVSLSGFNSASHPASLGSSTVKR